MRKLMFVSLVTIGLAAPVLAQDKKVEVNLGGGPTFPMSDFKKEFNTGGNFDIGATYWITPTIGIQSQYVYTRLNGPEKTITVTTGPGIGVGSTQLLQSNQQIHAGVFDMVVRSHNTDSAANGYFLGGLGIYHRGIQITSPAVGYTTFCDPYWYVCYPAPVAVDNILGERSSNDFGINFGAGVTFGHESKFYIEARYTYVWGPTINVPSQPIAGQTSSSGSTNMAYFPLIFGVKF